MPINSLPAALAAFLCLATVAHASDSVSDTAAAWWETVKDYTAEKAAQISAATDELMDDMADQIEELQDQAGEARKTPTRN